MTDRSTGSCLALLAAGPLAGAVVALSFLACSSSGSGLPPGDDSSEPSSSGSSSGSTGGSSSSSSSGSGSSGGSSSGSGSGSGSGSSSGSHVDASTAPVKSEISFSGGLPLCGTTACDLTKNICCVTQTAQGSCIPNTQTCPSGDATFKCVQKTDCPGNDICCGVANESTSSAGSQCEDVSSTNQECTPVATGASSTQGSAQVCQTTAECKNGMTCQWQTCNVSGALIEPQLTMCGIQSAAPFNCTAHP